MVFTEYSKAREAAEAAGLAVLGYADHGNTRGYVLVDKEADDVDCRNAAFEAMRGRPIDHREELLLSLVEARSAES